MFIKTVKKNLINSNHIVQILVNYEVKKAIDDSFYILFSNFNRVDNFEGDKALEYCLCIMVDSSQHVCLLDTIDTMNYMLS